MNAEICLVLRVMRNCSVPLKQPERSKWIEKIEKVQPFDDTVATYHVCQFHFLPEDLDIRGKRKYILPGRVPSVFANNDNNDNTVECFGVNAIGASVNNSESTNFSSAVSNAAYPVQNTLSIEEATNETISSSSSTYEG